VRQRVNFDDIYIDPDALQEARDDFKWCRDEIKKCLLKLNDKYYFENKTKNHYYNSKPHKKYPTGKTFYDYYRAYQLLDGENVYTHFFIREQSTTVTIDSFKDLIKEPEDARINL
jgi:anaerobic selenocysteine-containing dehydrogenase